MVTTPIIKMTIGTTQTVNGIAHEINNDINNAEKKPRKTIVT